MISKSLFTNEVKSGSFRVIYNPVYFDPNINRDLVVNSGIILQEIANVIQTVIQTLYLDRLVYVDRVGYLDRVEY